jgi:hypothetical protein
MPYSTRIASMPSVSGTIENWPVGSNSSRLSVGTGLPLSSLAPVQSVPPAFGTLHGATK